MNEPMPDIDLLRAFSRQGDQAAFKGVVSRHIDLVYGTAMRKSGDSAASEEIAQDVFAALARRAWQFAPDDSLPAWLYQTTLFKTKQWLRGQMRRQRREQTAAELGTTMKTPEAEPALSELMPLLDEALITLAEKDRAALLLRFYESRSLREVGLSLGVSEDTAQKRVAAALGRLARFFQERGFKTATAAVAAAALEQSAISAPAALSQAVAQATLASAPATVGGLTGLLGRVAGLTKVQTAALCFVVAAAPLAWKWAGVHAVEKRAALLRVEAELARARQEEAALETKRLRAESERVENVAAAATAAGDEAALRLSQLKVRMQSLGDVASRWQEDLPFVRVPKWALRDIGSHIPSFGPGGKLSAWAEEVLGLTPEQKEAVEVDLARYLQDIDRLAAGRSTETNWTSADGSHHKKVFVPALGEEGRSLESGLSTNLAAIVGPERVSLVMAPLFSYNQWLSSERVSHELITAPQEFGLDIVPSDSGPPKVTYTWAGHLAFGAQIDKQFYPQFLIDSFEPWARQLGFTNEIFTSSGL